MRPTVIVQRKIGTSVITENKTASIGKEINNIGQMINTADSITLKCSLMISFLRYADKSGFLDKAVEFLHTCAEKYPTLAKRLVSYHRTFKDESSLNDYILQSFKTVWYSKEATINDKKVMIAARKFFDYPVKLLPFVK